MREGSNMNRAQDTAAGGARSIVFLVNRVLAKRSP